MKIHAYLINFILLCSISLLSACSTDRESTITTDSEQFEMITTAEPALNIPAAKTVWLDTKLPKEFLEQFYLPLNWVQMPRYEDAYWKIEINDLSAFRDWIYVLVAPFPTITDNVNAAEFFDLWQTGSSQSIHVRALAMTQETKSIISLILGNPAPDFIEVSDQEDLLELAWSNPQTWAIVPFERLESKWKVISIDGEAPIQADFQKEAYLFRIPISITSTQENQADIFYLRDELLAALPANYDPDLLTTLIMTGVTAIVRGTAATMEYQGMTYPAAQIGDFLRSADITHVSNEIAFSPSCPQPHFQGEVLAFCSQPEYIELLEYIGTDVVEMTGDHFIDVADEDVLYTIDLYDQEDWGFFGGGRNIEEAKAPLYLNHNGNKIGFIGCNAKEIGYATASETRPGAVHCDWNYLNRTIPLMVADGYTPIMTFSHLEYYQYQALPQLVDDFHKAADAGAVIVSGSQGHQPQAIEFYKGAFLHYGLGNLFFDQFKEGMPQRQSFLDRHVFYNGRHVSTELFTIIFIDLAQSRFMTDQERSELLQTVFQASGWQIINP